jgi:hypothetical protein
MKKKADEGETTESDLGVRITVGAGRMSRRVTVSKDMLVEWQRYVRRSLKDAKLADPPMEDWRVKLRCRRTVRGLLRVAIEDALLGLAYDIVDKVQE